MKKYKKKPTKLLQIRLSELENKEVVEFIKKFGVTHREWILSVINELREAKTIRENRFWISDMDYAHSNSSKYDKQLDENSICEECGKKNMKDYRGYWQLERHHYLGYQGDNAFKVKTLCKPCHYKYKKKDA